MASYVCIMAILFLTLAFFIIALASDQSPIQDFCVADTGSTVLLNGLTCKDPKQVVADDFCISGLHIAANTSNALGFHVTPVTPSEMPGLNTLGISIVRIDYAPQGINPLHTHPRASEILIVLEGSLEVGFITSFPENRHIGKVLQKGDAFVFPVGLVHYQRNPGPTNAVAMAALSSQNPGVIIVANAVFGATPNISSDILEKSFHINKKVIGYLQTKL